jgi:hypothetical protein
VNKEQKQRLLEELHSDELHNKIISSVKNESERRQVKSFTDEIYISLIDSLMQSLINLEENNDNPIPKE